MRIHSRIVRGIFRAAAAPAPYLRSKDVYMNNQQGACDSALQHAAATDASIAGSSVSTSDFKALDYNQSENVHIIVDSTSDIPVATVKRLGFEVINFSYIDDRGVEHEDDMWQSISSHEFYEHMRKNPTVHYTTAAVTPGKYYEVFKRAAEVGTPTLYMGLSAGLSSSIDSARRAQSMIHDEYPNFELYVLDNRCDSAAGALLAMEVANQASLGLTARELYEWARDARYFLHGFFTLENFNALAAGGRIPPAAASVGGKLNIKPVLSYDLNGALTLSGMCRGRKKALRAMLQSFAEQYAFDTSLPMALASSDCEKDTDWLEKEIRKIKGCERLTIVRTQVSAVLGVHTGPDMAALVFWGSDRRTQQSLADKIAQKIKRSMGAQ